MQSTQITAHGDASWNRLPDGTKEKILQALKKPVLNIEKIQLKDRPGLFAVRIDGLRIVFSEQSSVRTIHSVLTASEFNAFRGD